MILGMPWFAWLYVTLMAACVVGVIACCVGIERKTREIDRVVKDMRAMRAGRRR